WSNNAHVHYNEQQDAYTLIGDPTEGALSVLAEKGNEYFSFETPPVTKEDDFPFSSHLKMRATLVDSEGDKELLVVGAPEYVLKKCSFVLNKDGVASALDDEQIHLIREKIEAWSSQAMRVIALAYREESSN